jgi:hypothetical protein
MIKNAIKIRINIIQEYLCLYYAQSDKMVDIFFPTSVSCWEKIVRD